MRLVLKLAAPWTAAAPAAGEALAFTRDDLRLYVTALDDRFASPTRRGLSAEAGVEIMSEADARSALGWPVRVTERAHASSDGLLREIEVRYAFFEFGASAVVVGPADSVVRHRDEILAAAFTGSPDWTDAVACIAELLAAVGPS